MDNIITFEMETKTQIPSTDTKPATLEEILAAFSGDFPGPPEDAPRHEIRTMKDLFLFVNEENLVPFMKDLINVLMFYVSLKQADPEATTVALEGNDVYTWIEDGKNYLYQSLHGEDGDFLMRITPPPIHIVQETEGKTEILIKRVSHKPTSTTNGEQSPSVSSGAAGDAVQTN